MRILCLHGRGTNAAIFEQQLQPLIRRLPAHYQYDFVDGPVPVNPAPGIADHSAGPYLAWHRRSFSDEVEEAHGFLSSIVSEDGPYDGVIGFSQGAGMAAGLLIAASTWGGEAAAAAQGAAPPFRFAIFLCSQLPLATSWAAAAVGSSAFLADLTDEALEYERRPAMAEFLGLTDSERAVGRDTPPGCGNGGGRKIYRYGLGPLEAPAESQTGHAGRTGGGDGGGGPLVGVPTLHLVSPADGFEPFGRQVASLCDPARARLVSSPSGHMVPHDPELLDKLAAEIQDLVVEAELVDCLS
ncbi:serine hydrolase-domain-containing protein [Microdochium trichocladiopsis]|uniref:Serine hydrolase-domain-containing protein n=1 Tax=Microdochium trichocladiopsis TaxID=1682393 RepID=A0A9P9BWV1_9PEZI|nr:serine hydrolase-domain-containing protein [Microdochium trichocladiopsis]KAH7041157.1 serine hydrolase-domain-containing protein [Microdochium trichocladiopsis]